MNKIELRRRLRREGFVNHEIAAIHMQYLMMKAAGIADEHIIFDREHGLLVDKAAQVQMDAMVGMKVAPDVKYDCVYVFRDDGTRVKLGPF